MNASVVSRLGCLVFMFVLAYSHPPAWAQTQAGADALTDADKTAIRSVVQRQIEAFQRDDGPAAFALASPAIRAHFGDAATFLAMVRQSYQPVYRPRHVTYLEPERTEDQVILKVLILGPDGTQVMAVYPMAQLPDGTWATDGCVLVELPSKSA